MKKIRFFNQSGFTLAEVMVAAGLMGILSLALVNQSRLVGASKKESNESTIINRITDRLSTELSNRATCTYPENFGGKTISTTPISLSSLVDSDKKIIVQVNGTYGAKIANNSGNPAIDNSVSAANVNSVQVDTITVRQNPANTNEMFLKVAFKKKRGFSGVFTPASSIELPITVIHTAGFINYCYNDLTNSITSAIRLSCMGSNNSVFDPSQNNGYGACLHNVQSSSCAAGKYIKKIEFASGVTQYSCVALEEACPANKFITNFNADGSVSCGDPMPSCAPGTVMIMGPAGKYICTSGGCSGLNAIKRFNSDGSITCEPFYPPRSCIGLVKSISPTSITCDAYVQPVTCPPGQFVSNIDASGVPTCTKFINYPQACPAGEAVSQIDASGNIICQPITRRLSCGGSMSPNGKTFINCQSDSGTIMNRDGLTNSFCHFNLSSCPAGYNVCNDWRHTTNAVCTDTNSACPGSVLTRTTLGSGSFQSPVIPSSVECYDWADNPGIGTGCTQSPPLPAVITPTVEIGCY